MEIRVNEEDYLALLKDREHLRKQRDELQASGTHLELENRDLRKIIRRTPQYVFRSDAISFDLHRSHCPIRGALTAEQVKEENTLAAMWEELSKEAQ